MYHLCDITVVVCGPVEEPEHGFLDCEDDGEGNLNCTAQCDVGYDFGEEPLPYYYCNADTAHKWNFQTEDNPLGRIPDCQGVIVLYHVKCQVSYCSYL